jgi:C4-dicarboxylate transporter, DctM subunit
MAAAATLSLALIFLLGAGVWIGLALIATGLISLELMRDSAALSFLAGDVWRSFNAPELVSLPLFILMGELLTATRLSQQLFAALAPLTSRIPGGLAHTNVLGCTIFAAVSGSSAATTATIGRITLPELLSRGYDKDLAIGSLCGAGTLGFLIPPSIIMIVYGVLSDTSILDLFLAGVIPGLLLATMFMAYIAVRGGKAPREAGRVITRGRALLDVLPVAGLIIAVIGSMYAGLAGPSEAAVVGVAGALAIAAVQRRLSLGGFWNALQSTIATCAMLGLVMAGAFFLSKVFALFGLPTAIAAWVEAQGLNPYLLIAMLLMIYVGLGCILDGLSMIVMTLPIALPMVEAAGFSPVWFGIFLVIVVEMAQITPPVGFNLFVVRDLTGEPLGRIARAAFPFFLILATLAALITIYPPLVTGVLQ